MEVRDLMTTDVVAVGPTASIRDAARLMFRYRVSGLPVVDVEDHVLGIVTEGDFLQMEIERLESGSVPEQVGSVMSKSVMTIPPDMDIIGAARFMKDQDVKRLVVAEGGKMVGIISRFDIVAAVHTTGRLDRGRNQGGPPSKGPFRRPRNSRHRSFERRRDTGRVDWHAQRGSPCRRTCEKARRRR